MKRFLVVALVVCLMAVAGCATLGKVVNEHGVITRLAVEAATARVLLEHPTWRPKTVSITQGAMAVIDTGTVTDLGTIESYVRERISWSRLTPEEQALLSTLISAAVTEISDSLAEQKVEAPELQLVEVRKVIGWIHETAARNI